LVLGQEHGGDGGGGPEAAAWHHGLHSTHLTVFSTFEYTQFVRTHVTPGFLKEVSYTIKTVLV